MATPTASKPKSQLSLEQVKELIAFARKERVMVLELDSLRFQFAPGALEPDEPPPPKKSAKPDDEATPYGHYKPE